MNDPIKTIGKVLTGKEQRDAIHIAVLPCQAAEDLHKGAEVGLVYGTANQIKDKPAVYGLNPIGIVDPFLEHWSVKKGEWVWVFLFPNSGMRHHWQHPAVDAAEMAEAVKKSQDEAVAVLDAIDRMGGNDSEDWLRSFADRWNFDYGDMVQGAKAGKYVTARGIDLHSAEELDKVDEQLFWYHIERVTRMKFDEKHRDGFSWSCSC